MNQSITRQPNPIERPRIAATWLTMVDREAPEPPPKSNGDKVQATLQFHQRAMLPPPSVLSTLTKIPTLSFQNWMLPQDITRANQRALLSFNNIILIYLFGNYYYYF